MLASPPELTQLPFLDDCILGPNPSDLPNKSLRWGDVIEIQGPPASGKTHLLYHFIITCVIPSQILPLKPGGWGMLAVVYDTDGTFDVHRLYDILLNRLLNLRKEQSGESSIATPADLDGIAQQALANLYIFRPTSSVQLATSLLGLPSVLMNHDMPQRDLGLVAIDSLSAFHWKDRLTVEQIKGAQPSPPVSPLQHVLNSLQRIRASHSPIILLTNWALNPLSKPAPSSADNQPSPFYKQHLFPFPTPFAQSSAIPQPPSTGTATGSAATKATKLQVLPIPTPGDLLAEETAPPLPLTYHITLPAIHLPPIPASLSSAEAWEQEITQRRRVVNLGEVKGLVRTPQSSKIGQFTFRIKDDTTN